MQKSDSKHEAAHKTHQQLGFEVRHLHETRQSAPCSGREHNHTAIDDEQSFDRHAWSHWRIAEKTVTYWG